MTEAVGKDFLLKTRPLVLEYALSQQRLDLLSGWCGVDYVAPSSCFFWAG